MSNKYLVDIFVPYVKSVLVEASNPEEAREIVQAGYDHGDFDHADFRKTDDSEEISVYEGNGEAFEGLYPTYTKSN